MTNFANINEMFIFNTHLQYKFILIPDDIDYYTLLIKTEKTERTTSKSFEMEFTVGYEYIIDTFSTESFSGETVKVYHTIEQTGTTNIHRKDKSLKHNIIKVSSIIIISDLKML